MSLYYLPGFLGSATDFDTVAVVTVTSTDHGALAGLGDDDHTQYGALSQNESITGQWSFTNATAPIIAAKLGPSSTQQHGLPAVTSDTVGLLAAAQTFTNKTLTSPQLNTPKIGPNGSTITELRAGQAGSIADGGTIAHGLGAAPAVAIAQATVAGEFVSVTAVDGTNLTVAIKKHDGTAGTSQTLYWVAMR